jgi:hypothetical protein
VGRRLVVILYHFDLYPRDDPRDGARVVRFTKLQSAEYRGEANGTGAGEFTIRADTAEAQNIDPRGLQYVRVVREDTVAVTELVVGGFFLDAGDFSMLDEQGTRLLKFGGAGTLSYLARSIMASHTYISPIFTGQDPFDDTWRLYAQSTFYANGNFLGAMLWRVIYEAQHNTPGTHRHADGVNVSDTHADDRPAIAIPDLVMTFDQFEDTNGNDWAVSSGEFKAQIGDNVLSVVKRLMEAGLYVEMDPDTFELNAYPASTHRRDRTGVAWGASVVRFQAPTDGTIATGNIKSDAKRAITAFIKRSWVLAGGTDIYGDATGSSDIPWEGYYRADVNDASAAAGVAGIQVGARDDAGDTLRIRGKLGNSPTSGYYKPFEHVLLDDLATIHTGTDQFDLDEQDFPVAAMTVSLRPAGDWDVWYELGASYTVSNRQFQVGVTAHNHPPNPAICRDTPGSNFSSPLELLMRFRFRMAVTTQRHQLEMLLKDDTGAMQLQFVIDNGAGGGFSDQISVGALELDDSAANNTDGPATDGILTTVDDVWCFARVRTDSTGQAMIRLWKDGDPEPGAWDVETDDTPVDVDGSVPLINRIDFNIRAGDTASGSEVNIDSIEFVDGFSGLSSTESFNRVVASGAGTSEWNGVAYDGRTTDLSVDGSSVIDVAGSGAAVWGVSFVLGSTCIHGGENSNSGNAGEACGKCVAAGNHQHDYVAAGGDTGLVLAKASGADWATEWISVPSVLPLDIAPAVPSAWDDDFDGSVLDAKWTSPLTSTAAVAVSLADGWVHIEPSTSGTAVTNQTGGFGIRQNSPSGDFSVMAKVAEMQTHQATPDDARAGLWVSNGTVVHVVGVNNRNSRIANAIANAAYSESADWGTVLAYDQFVGPMWPGIVWFRIRWDSGAGTLFFDYSANGVTWRNLNSRTGQTQPTRLGLVLYSPNATTVSVRADHEVAADWLRVLE